MNKIYRIYIFFKSKMTFFNFKIYKYIKKGRIKIYKNGYLIVFLNGLKYSEYIYFLQVLIFFMRYDISVVGIDVPIMMKVLKNKVYH